MTTSDEIRQAVKFVHGTDTMEEVVKIMNAENISSVLVLDDKDHVSGIITERDIVRKFTLFERKDHQDKLEATANAIMTRPVKFARLDHLQEDIRQLHLAFQVRHFPVCETTPVTKDNVVGMMTATDICRRYLRLLGKSESVMTEEDKKKPRVLLVGGMPASDLTITRLLKEMGCEVLKSSNPMEDLGNESSFNIPAIVDLDHNYGSEFPRLITQASKHPCDVVFLTSNLKMAQDFRKTLRGKKLHVMMKPIDISFLSFLFQI